ncbi:hypothetical protein [Desulfospira joergensenii]|uniref:hypothetical protein n=1 Tax=Desulfospira joergensenii TaxID=53329 RepID=UPI0003B67839|nr:hypothetical protein [Desulfospira joergensenii]
MPKKIPRLFFLLTYVFLLSGCAYQYTDGNGARHIIGFAHVIQKETKEQKKEMLVQQVSVIGVSILMLPEHSGVAVGYTKNFSIEILKDDVSGELSIDTDNPSSFKYKDINSILKEKNK